MEAIANETLIEERLPWHKPQIGRLVISEDTRSDFGSGGDLADEETFG